MSNLEYGLSMARPRVLTIGYEGRSVDDLIADLHAARVERLVDVRELPLSRRRGFSKTALGAALADAGIEYEHIRALGNPKPYREMYWAGEPDEGADHYRRHLHNGSHQALCDFAASIDGRVCLLCVEREAELCHRAVLVDSLLELRPEFAVEHL